MCNEFARRMTPDQLRAGWGIADAKMLFPEGIPNMPVLDSIRITEMSAILRVAAGEAGAAELVTRRWSWPGAHGKPVYNFRSDGREFENKSASGRCLIPASSFYEYTDQPVAADAEPSDLFGAAPVGRAKKPAKAKWEFSVSGLEWFCIAGLWRTDPVVGEAWTMLTTEPGPDIAPYHNRQVVLVQPQDWERWLVGEAPASIVCKPAPEGTLTVKRVR